MPKFLILKRYQGGPAHEFPMMNEWTEDEVSAHMAFQRHVIELLRERGELVDVRGLRPEGTYVRYGGPDQAPVTDGPFPETKELAAGWFLIDVESQERAHEIAAYVSSAPGPAGKPLYEWLEVRPVFDDEPAAER
jgi:hypothetical protein